MGRLKGRRQGRLVPGLTLACAFFTAPFSAVALDQPLQIAQYAHTSWTAQDGAEMGLPFAMAQTPDGYLWIAGSFGLFRFDGLRFMQWQPPDGQSLPSSPYSLAVSRDGTLWIGTYRGLSSWNGRTFTRQHPEIGKEFVTSLLEARDGTIWVGVLGQAGRLCAIRSERIQCTTPEQDGGFGKFAWSLAEDRAGTLWVGAESGIWRWSPGTPRRYPAPGLRVGDLTTTTDGQVLAGILGGGIRQLASDEFVPLRFRRAGKVDEWLADGDIKSNKLLRDRDGGLWIGTEGQGLIHVKDGLADTFSRADGLSGNISCSLFEDREGNIWFGSNKGVDRFRKLPVTTVSARQGLPHELTRSILATRDGSMWVATGDGLARWKDGRLAVYKERDGLPHFQVHSQYQDADGRLWVSTAGGLVYFANDRFVAVDAGPSKEIHAMTGDAAGNLWLSGDKGLARLYRGRFVENIAWADLGRQQPAQSIVADQGGLWLAFWDRSGALYFKDGKVQATYGAAQGLGERHIGSLRLDDDGALWLATASSGLGRIKDGHVTTLSVANGLPCNGIHWSLLDDGGSLWMFTVCGLVQVGREDLAAWTGDPARRVTAKLWGGADGVPRQLEAPTYYNPAVAKGADGRIWSVGVADVQIFDPAHMPSNPVPPPVHIEAIVADHRSYAATGELRLPPLVRDVAIEFAALTLSDPKSTRFRYRLQGHDNDWQEVVDRRVASYTNLPPGHYRFDVKAANNSGVWNEDGAQLEFTILPVFYQTTWFRISCAVLLIGLAWAGFQLRLHMRIRRLQREFETTLEGRLAERTRIARDLHDTLLQRFHALLLQFQAASNLLPDRPRESKQILTGAIDQVAEAIAEGRDTVQGLRASTVETNNLAHSLRTLAQHLANDSRPSDAAQVQVNVDVHGTPQALHPLVRDETFHIASEALRNAFRHAEPSRIDVEIHYDPRELRVLVRDDGGGIAPDVLLTGEKQGHFGLSGMRERAELAGGTLTVRSSAQAGTEVEFSAPGSRAYGKPSPARSWLLPKKSAPSEIGE
jgi:signal transduction histidine kinase/ligand-binding sensor domain-containing protein